MDIYNIKVSLQNQSAVAENFEEYRVHAKVVRGREPRVG